MSQCGLYPWQCTGSGKCSLCNTTVSEISRGMRLAARKMSSALGGWRKQKIFRLADARSLWDSVRAFIKKLKADADKLEEKFPGGMRVSLENQCDCLHARTVTLEEALTDAISRMPDTLSRERLQKILYKAKKPKRRPGGYGGI